MVITASAEIAERNMSPGDLLDIGSSRRNHYAVQVAPNDNSNFDVHSQAEIGSGYAALPRMIADFERLG